MAVFCNIHCQNEGVVYDGQDTGEDTKININIDWYRGAVVVVVVPWEGTVVETGVAGEAVVRPEKQAAVPDASTPAVASVAMVETVQTEVAAVPLWKRAAVAVGIVLEVVHRHPNAAVAVPSSWGWFVELERSARASAEAVVAFLGEEAGVRPSTSVVAVAVGCLLAGNLQRVVVGPAVVEDDSSMGPA